MIEWIILGLIAVAAMVYLLRSDDRKKDQQAALQQYCDLECKDCEVCRR